MSSLNFLPPPCIVGIVVVLSCTRAFINCNIIIPGGTVTFSDFKRLRCQVDVSEIESKRAQSLITCVNLCAADDSCSMVHYQRNTSRCMLDTRPVSSILEDAIPVDNTLRSFVRNRYVCDDNWTSFDRSCYHVSPNYHAWPFCRTYCEKFGSNLSSIRSDREMEFASRILPILPLNDKYIHIGGTRYPDDKWKWVNGEPWDYTKWDPREPSSVAGEDYLAIFHLHALVEWKESGWNDIQYYEDGYCICEKPALNNFMELTAPCLSD